MKRFIQLTILLFVLFIGLQHTYSQCTPADSIDCPDPEENGQICPKIPDTVFVGLEYLQEVTILPPPKLDTNNLTITIHHITLRELGNLPAGITWESNVENNEFMAGTYYCLRLSGTTYADPGAYPVKIAVEAFTKIGNTIISLGQTIDSTTLSIIVEGSPNAIAENTEPSSIIEVWPNPFSVMLNIALFENPNEVVEIEIFNIVGNRVYYRKINEYTTVYKANLSLLSEGVYILSIKNNNKRHLKKIVKHRY
ncbi:MAG: T9SS type A sorting domain-containing protein [Bacteroidetes bacterium]|nr:T9SS type A sorting domain-containing protein [Bacteroidota bacterium]